MKSNHIYKPSLNYLLNLLINLVLFLKCHTSEEMSEDELLKHCQDLKSVFSVGYNCNVDC
jgi:hypothetical protein